MYVSREISNIFPPQQSNTIEWNNINSNEIRIYMRFILFNWSAQKYYVSYVVPICEWVRLLCAHHLLCIYIFYALTLLILPSLSIQNMIFFVWHIQTIAPHNFIRHQYRQSTSLSITDEPHPRISN